MKVLVVDDEKPARDRLKQLLDDEANYEFAGEAENGIEAIKMAVETTNTGKGCPVLSCRFLAHRCRLQTARQPTRKARAI